MSKTGSPLGLKGSYGKTPKQTQKLHENAGTPEVASVMKSLPGRRVRSVSCLLSGSRPGAHFSGRNGQKGENQTSGKVERDPGYLTGIQWASAEWLPCLKMILLVCRSHYCTVWLLDVALDNCLWSIKWFCCLSTLFNWYFSHSCAAEKAQCCSKNQFIFPSAPCVL